MIIFKPDAVERGLVGTLLSRWETKGYEIVAMKKLVAEREVMELHYLEHQEQNFYHALVDRMIAGPIVVVVFQGKNVVQWSRAEIGPTDPSIAPSSTIRGRFAIDRESNVVHASDSVGSAKRELAVWSKHVF